METVVVVAWVLTMSGGVLMALLWLARGGARQREDEGIAPWALATHAAMALLGLGLLLGLLTTPDSDDNGPVWFLVVFALGVAAFGLRMFTSWRQHGRATRADRAIPRPVAYLHGGAAAATIGLLVALAAGLGD